MTQTYNRSHRMRPRRSKSLGSCALAAVLGALALIFSSCSGNGSGPVQASGSAVTVGVTKVVKQSLGREITLSSEARSLPRN